MKPQRCREHQSAAERICTFAGCDDRRMCMLCDHGHVFLPNLRQVLWLDYGRFRTKIESAIDEILGEALLPESKQEVKDQISQTNLYFEQAMASIKNALEQRREAILLELAGEEDDTVSRLRSLRVNGNYYQAPNDLFEVLMMLYQGGTLQQSYADKSARKMLKAQEVLNETCSLVTNLLKSLGSNKKQLIPTPPDLKLISAQGPSAKNGSGSAHYQPQAGRLFTDAHQCNQSRIQFESLISSAVEHNEHYFVSGYDKKLRIVSRDLDLLREIQFNNTLEQVCQLSEKQLVVAVSRELHVINVSDDKSLEVKTLMKLRGHEGKIVAVDKLNTRIVGSCSSEGLKIWDLYKEKEQYSLRKAEGLSDLKFVPFSKRLTLGGLDWSYKYYDVETMKLLKTYRLQGIPLTSHRADDNVMLVGGFPRTLAILDYRMPDSVFCEAGEDGITCINTTREMILGNRKGKAIVFDMRKKEVVLEWQAHEGSTSWNKPNGIAAILHGGRLVTTVGVNDRKLKNWNMI